MERGVLFDLGRVVVGLDFSRGLFGRLAGMAGATPEEGIERLRRHPLVTDFATGRIGAEAYAGALCRELGMRLSREEFEAAWCDIFEPRPAMEALFGEVADRLPVGVLSDTDPIHWAHLRRRLPVLARARPVLSFRVGALKPDPAMYRAGAAALGLPPEACFFIDDRAANVDGARAAGMDAVVFRDAETLREELVSRALL